jgi:hypothetical protein
MEGTNTSELQHKKYSVPPGLELEDLELLSSSLLIFYESAKKKMLNLFDPPEH